MASNDTSEQAKLKEKRAKEKAELKAMEEKLKGLGNLYNGKMYMKHREWRGFKDTAYDFYRWLITMKDLMIFVGRAPIRITKAMFTYRWLCSYLASPAFIDRHSMGLRGSSLKVLHLQYNAMIKNTTKLMATTFKADNRFGKNKLSDKVVLFDEMMPMHIMAGFPNLIGIPAQVAAVFQCSVMDQNSMIPYLDAIENYGLPADVCPLPACEAAVAILDEYPKMGKCYISSSMPCDGSVMASSFQHRYYDMPTFPLVFPVRYLDDSAEDYAVEEIRKAIAFIEENTGEKFDWYAFFDCMKRYNEETKLEMNKWEINKTNCPQVTGATLAMYRMYSFLISASRDPLFLKVSKKVDKIITKANENGEKCSKEQRHRAILWSPPAHYYEHYSLWAENCWGINVLVDMESLVATRMFSTDDKEQALKDIAYTFERMTMRRHTNGGYVNVLDELWRVCKDFNADMVLMMEGISCKTMAGLKGLFEEQARERGIHLVWVEHDLMDPRTVSRKSMRESLNRYMTTVLREEPVDPTLVDFDDEKVW